MEYLTPRVRIGVDLGGTKIEVAALQDEEKGPLLRRRIAAPQGDYEATLRAICGLVEETERILRDWPIGV